MDDLERDGDGGGVSGEAAGRRALVPGPGPMTMETGSAPSYNAWKTAEVLRGQGFHTVGIDSSDASLLGLPGCCDRFYLEPLCLESLEAVLERERPDLMISNCSGVKGMYLAGQLARSGVLKRYGVRLAGASLEVIYRTQDRALFKEVLMDAGLPVPRFVSALSLNDGIKAMQKVGFPLVIRPHFTSGGKGAARVCNQEEYLEKLMMALNLSPVHEVTVEEDFTGWKEFTCLAARDAKGETAVLALFEQLEMAGVHAGDSLWVHPAQTPGKELVYFIEEIAGKIARVLELCGVMELGVMVHPRLEEVHVCGALPGPGPASVFARLAAGIDLAGMNVLLALGHGLDETWTGPREREAAGLAVRVPYGAGGREGHPRLLDLERKSVGELVVLGEDFDELASRLSGYLDTGAGGGVPPGPAEGDSFTRMPPDVKIRYLRSQSARRELPPRQFQRDLPEWFYRLLQAPGGDAPAPVIEGGGAAGGNRTVLVLGGEPHHTGRGAEGDVNVAQALEGLREAGRRPVLYGENPLMALLARELGCGAALGPLDPKAVLACAAAGGAEEVITQFGGELCLSLTPALIEMGCRVPGLTLDLASFRGSYLRELRLFSEAGPRIIAEEEVATLEQALEWAEEVGYPLMVYPSRPQGSGRTSIAYGPEDLRAYHREAVAPGDGRLTMRPLNEDATEVMVEAIAGKEGTVILGLAQNLEDAGSAADDCLLAMPPLSLTSEQVEGVVSYLRRVIGELSIAGNLRARVVLKDGQARLDELYLGASSTLPFLGLVTGWPVQAWGIRAIFGMEHGASGETELPGRVMALRRTILPARVIAGEEEDILPASVRRSLGSVAGLGYDLGSAFAKAQMEEMAFQPGRRRLFISVANRDKRSAVMMAKEMIAMGFRILATAGTAEALRKGGAEVRTVKKLREGRPNVLDLIKNGEVDLIVNTPRGKGPRSDGFYIRKASAGYAIPCITNMHAATLLVEALTARREGRLSFADLEAYRDRSGNGAER